MIAAAPPPADATAQRIAAALGARSVRTAPLRRHGAAILHRVEADGGLLFAKTAPAMLHAEGRALAELARRGFPAPAVHHFDDTLVVTDWIETDGGPLSEAGAEEAADSLCRLHAETDPLYGLGWDGAIGGQVQLNEQFATWLEFFRHKRLVQAAWLAMRTRRLSARTFGRVERLGERLGEFLVEPPRPALLHGDLRLANTLRVGGRVAAFVGPAIHFGHPESDLAAALDGGFPPAFARRFVEIAPPAPGFDARRALLGLPALLMAAAAGTAEEAAAAAVLDRHGL